MRVKKLEVFGFKSFAQKTTIHFEPGVTAIVGPNGSGKTNVVDAVRWVLGEHNPRDIRAPRLEDVIFNGTDTRAPLSMAEVRLTIANEQGLLPIAFTEVMITRRVFRSGESEYLINQSPCRLKDIQELFLGTGLGGGTYAIIEQGHIDLILSSKPEERRMPFEEASGVAKYLAKKHETMRRLDEVEEHLLRIADIIGEVRRQVGALERAANKARAYKAQWEQLKMLEVRLAVDELSAGETQFKTLEHRLQTLTTQRDALERETQGQMASLERCNAAVSTVSEQLQALRTTVVECASQIEQHASQQGLKARWIEELTEQIRRLDTEEAQLRARLAQIEEQLARLGGGEAELLTQQATIQPQREQGQSELDALEAAAAATAATITEAKAQLFEAAADASHQRNELAEHASRLQSLEAQLVRLEESATQRQARAEDVHRRHEALQQERETLQEQCDDIQRRIAQTQQALDEAVAHRHELSGRVHQLRQQLASERAQVKLFEDLWRHYEGFPDTVKTLMSRPVDGLIGPLVDVIRALPGHEDVVEAALGPLADALIVRDRQALTRCREALSTHQLEGCRFLVLSDCPAVPHQAEAPAGQAGLAGAVKQFIRSEPQYQPLVDWLLNDSWVIDDLQRLLGDGSPPLRRFVSLQGDRWDRRSWRFRGARVASQGRLGRKQRWEHALANLQTLEQSSGQLEAQAQQAEQEWQTLLTEQESAKGQWAHLSPSLQKLYAQLNQLTHEAQRLDEERQALDVEMQELADQREERRTALALAQRAAEDAAARQQVIERSLADAQAASETSLRRRQELVVVKAQVEATLQSLTERLTALQSRRQEIDADRTHAIQQLEGRARQRQEALARRDELSQQLQHHEQERARLTQERARREADVETSSCQLRDAEAARDQIVPHLLSCEQRLSELLRQIQEQSQQVTERTFRHSRLIERLRELYQVDDATLQAERQAGAAALSDAQRASMTAHVQTLRAKLEGMGPVSLGSVEEYDELKRRHEFLQRQQQDLLKARDDLKASITQINRTARTQFRETFERIKQEFQHYYTRLFDGGQADLILMDEDVLECGIDIVARPPGKRLQSISLLSGGERALTAIALLFALFKVRPSPFCILDEIDAPLDEANIDRFTRVLEEFLSLSQFILITHNKTTITRADSLYGVTMEEPGISKILSAKLTKSNGAPTEASPIAAA